MREPRRSRAQRSATQGSPRGVLHHSFGQPDVALAVELGHHHERARVVADAAQQRVDDLRVGAVVVDEHQAVEPVVDQRAGDVVVEVDQHLGADRDRAGALPGLVHVLGGVAHPDARRVQHLCIFRGAARHLLGLNRVGAQWQVWPMLLQARDRDHHDVFFEQVGVDVRGREVREVVGEE